MNFISSMESDSKMTVSDLAVKFKSKSQLYDFMTREGGIYLSPKQHSIQKILREIMLGNKLP